MYSPAEVARRYVETGRSKAALPTGRMLLLGMLAGAFIALAGGSATFAVSYGGRLAGAAVFPAGLAMVLLAGSELFTGNCLLVIPLLERQLTWGRMLRSWGVVYLANVLGAGLVAASPWRQAPSTGIRVRGHGGGQGGPAVPDGAAAGRCCATFWCASPWMSLRPVGAEAGGYVSAHLCAVWI
ncbi:MAG: formate/nitrite transporter family protein [Oscillospiraceae bacterium]